MLRYLDNGATFVIQSTLWPYTWEVPHVNWHRGKGFFEKDV